MSTYTYLTYNGITKVVTDTLIKTQAHPNKVLHIQWFRYQIIKMCEILNITIKEPISGGIYNNTTLANKIMVDPQYGKLIIHKDNLKFGLKPCLEHKSIMSIPANNNKLKKNKNNITLINPKNIIWKCGPRNAPLIAL
jgi:hypothetical protein